MKASQSIQQEGGPADGPRDSRPVGRERSRKRRPRLEDALIGVALLAGPANTIMQLARPEVGYGVLESRVESGRADLHPIKRARTTLTYLAVAVIGSDAQKAAFRRAVSSVHARVYSTPDSPVRYRASDPELQMWVAACLYQGALVTQRTFIGEPDERDAERHYREGMTLGSTMQVPVQMWPENRAAFDRYWQESLDKVHIDDAIRDYLHPLALGRLRGLELPRPLRRWAESRALLITTGFLPQRFRDEMRFTWDAARQRRFDRLMALARAGNRLLPRFVRRFPFNLLLWDVRRRMKSGRPLV